MRGFFFSRPRCARCATKTRTQPASGCKRLGCWGCGLDRGTTGGSARRPLLAALGACSGVCGLGQALHALLACAGGASAGAPGQAIHSMFVDRYGAVPDSVTLTLKVSENRMRLDADRSAAKHRNFFAHQNPAIPSRRSSASPAARRSGRTSKPSSAGYLHAKGYTSSGRQCSPTAGLP